MVIERAGLLPLLLILIALASDAAAFITRGYHARAPCKIAAGCQTHGFHTPRSSTATFASAQTDTSAASVVLPDYILQHAIAWCSCNGLLMAPNGTFTHTPITLAPTALPMQAVRQAEELQPIYNSIVDKIARDKRWLTSTLAETALGDPFTARLLDIYESIPEVVLTQEVFLGIHRSDYMMHTNEKKLLQVELNTIASSFASLSTKVAAFHRHMVSRFGNTPEYAALLRQSVPSLNNPTDILAAMPEYDNIVELARSMAMAFVVYGNPEATVLFVCQPGEGNVNDQRLLEIELWDSQNVKVIRKTLNEISNQGELRGPRNTLFINGEEIGLVYFRAGYTPTDYPTEAEWYARIMVEKSTAIKCPSIAYQLAGTKKVQQVLAQRGELERFVNDEDAHKIRNSFAGLFGLGSDRDELTIEAIEDAKRNPDEYVLKPQREGGGNNIYGHQVAEFLNAQSPDIASYILMQRIRPPSERGTFLRKGVAFGADSISELGIYGVFLGDGGDEGLINQAAGYLLRTKAANVDEGGVASGFAVLNSPVLVDEQA